MTPDSTEERGTAPVRWRFGKLSLIFLAIVGVGLVVNLALNADDPPTDPEATEFDVASFPKGALGGEPAPDVSFPLFDGTTFSMADHFATDGRPVVLNFWASWCFPCRTEMPEFSEVAEENPDVAFIGVAVDDAESSAGEFAEEIGVSYPLGFDEAGAVASSYPYIGLPTTFLIGADGVVTHQIQGQVTGTVLQAFIDHDFAG